MPINEIQLELSPIAFSSLLNTMKQLFREVILFRVHIDVIPVYILLYVWTFRLILSKYEFLCDMKKICSLILGFKNYLIWSRIYSQKMVLKWRLTISYFSYPNIDAHVEFKSIIVP